MVTLRIPSLSLVLLIGASGCGKSTFARRHFATTEVVSSDACRGVVCDDENSLEATADAFDLVQFIVRKRLAAGKLTVIDATNVRPEDRKPLLRLAQEFHAMAVAIVFNVPEDICHAHNADRPNRQFGPHVVRSHTRAMRQSLRGLEREGFRHVYILRTPEQVDEVTIERTRLWTDRRDECGPFDIVGDVHGCAVELRELLAKLGYSVEELNPPERANAVQALDGEFAVAPTLPVFHRVTHPEGRRIVFLGDLVDRGPNSVDVLKLAMSMLATKAALCVPGNHDVKLLRALRGRQVTYNHGLEKTIEQLSTTTQELRDDVAHFIDGLISHYVLDSGNLVVAHAGMKQEMQGRASGRVRDFALYGESTGETDEFGLPVRYPWAADYRGRAKVVYGHTPVLSAEWLNGTICVDTGCVFGGKLTALRYPEMELVDVPANEVYAEPKRPLGFAAGLSPQHEADDLLDIADVSGKMLVHTRLRGNLTIREENATAALEAMSRFAANPKWIVYLPPTMSPTETTSVEGLLEHPLEGFAYYRNEGIRQVVCEEKHMGSRAVVALCKTAEVAAKRFGVDTGERGGVLTRTGRRFFDDAALECALLDQIDASMGDLWGRLGSDWVVLDCELMPWSAKAQQLLRGQYAPVGASSRASTGVAADVLRAARGRLPEDVLLQELDARNEARHAAAEGFVDAYRRYCWPVNGLDGLRLAPFHILASEGKVHIDQPHTWHMETLAEVCGRDSGVLLRTPYRVVDLGNEASVAGGVEWWEDLTARGGEGMVIKPIDFLATGAKGIVQPAVKCRGKEYLRIIYGPEYSLDENLVRLRRRGLTVKRSLALREFALGIEALERFVACEPLRRVHECVFAVLALESEPVDPRL